MPKPLSLSLSHDHVVRFFVCLCVCICVSMCTCACVFVSVSVCGSQRVRLTTPPAVEREEKKVETEIRKAAKVWVVVWVCVCV